MKEEIINDLLTQSMNPRKFYRIFNKSEQLKKLNDPVYLLQNEYVPNTPLMRVLAKDILFCRYQFQSLDSDNYLVNDGTDYGKLKQLLLYDYDIDINVERCFASHRLFRLMQYVENNVSQENRDAVLDRDKATKAQVKELFQLICNCCEGRPPHLDSNPAFLNIDFKKFEEELYRQYHMFLSPYDRRQLNTVEAIIVHLIFRFRDGGQIHNK
jgi:hypothetical protein